MSSLGWSTIPTALLRAFAPKNIHIICSPVTEIPMAVCVTVDSPGDCAIAVNLLSTASPESRVIFQGKRYAPDGSVQPCDPIQPLCAEELVLAFDVTWIEKGPCPWVYIRTTTEQEWEQARQAVRMLLQHRQLSIWSFIESTYTGTTQGTYIGNLDKPPVGPDVVAMARELALAKQRTPQEHGCWEQVPGVCGPEDQAQPTASSSPFPTNLFRALGEDPITVIAHDSDGEPLVVCVRTAAAFDRAAALVLLEKNPESFVLSDGLRLSPNGQVEPWSPAQPHYAGELHLSFDVEWVELGPQPRVHVFCHTEQEWEDARKAVTHLFQLGRLSSLSYVESDHTGEDQGVFVKNVDGVPHGPGMVAMIREAAYCRQNGLYERPEYEEEDYEAEDETENDDEWEEDTWDEDDEWEQEDAEDGQDEEVDAGNEWAEEGELAEAGASRSQREASPQERFAQVSRRFASALASWWDGGKITTH
jgi:hypothetical protein